MKLARIGLGLLVLLLLGGCASDLRYNWDLSVVLPLNPEGAGRFYYMIGGFWLTLQISLLSTVFGVIFGLCVAFLGLSRLTVDVFGATIKVYLLFRFVIRIYLEVIRNMPVFVLMLWARLSKNAVFWPNSLPSFWPRSYHIGMPKIAGFWARTRRSKKWARPMGCFGRPSSGPTLPCRLSRRLISVPLGR